MGYCGPMGFPSKYPLPSWWTGKAMEYKGLCLSEVWVMKGSTVCIAIASRPLKVWAIMEALIKSYSDLKVSQNEGTYFLLLKKVVTNFWTARYTSDLDNDCE